MVNYTSCNSDQKGSDILHMNISFRFRVSVGQQRLKI